MLKVKDGDLDKLGLLFERYKKPLFGFFYGMNHDAALSEDLVQNVFLRILKYRYLFRGEGDFRTWMFHIARNVRHDQHRKDKTWGKDDVARWEDQLGHDDHRISTYQREESEQLLAMAMARLPDDKREVLYLAKYEERRYKEIGELLQCTEAAVKVKVFRAVQELKEIYRQLEARL